VLAQALPALEQAAGVEVQGRVAASPNAFGIVAELGRRSYSEIILETLPKHVSHRRTWAFPSDSPIWATADQGAADALRPPPAV